MTATLPAPAARAVSDPTSPQVRAALSHANMAPREDSTAVSQV